MATNRAQSREASAARTQLLDQLKQDHKRVKKAYRDFQKLDCDTQPEACRTIVQQVCADLTLHATLEEEILYPAARGALKDQDLMDEAGVEHEGAKTLIAQLESMGPGDDKYVARFTVLCEYVLHHVKEEEGEMFPQFESARLDWEALLMQMTERREALLPSGVDVDDDSVGAITPPHPRRLLRGAARQRAADPPRHAVMKTTPVLIVFSHLRWGFVYQRPQHLLSRLAGRWRVLFIEEPVHTDGPARIEARSPCSDLTVLVPHTPVPAPGFHDDQIALLQPLIAEYLQRAGIQEAVAWLYTPMALPLANSLAPRVTVYDCMDELAAFKDAPRQLRQRETALMKQAAVVFTGGPSLYEAKRPLHANAHYVPSSVDAAHYAPSNLQPGSDAAERADALQSALAAPRLGYFGVIDERLDIELVALLADSHPDWQIVMVGPVVKIDPAQLPQRPNIHWLGMQPYAVLPYLLAGWDVALMPFALNESTRFISPTKTLEYMAGEKPVVSTAIADVILLYGNAVAVARSQAEFVQACADTLANTPAQRARLAMEMLTTVSTHSWDRSADSVHRELATALRAAMTAQPEPAAEPARAVAGGA